MAAEEAAKRASEQLGRLKVAKAAAEEAAAAAPVEEQAEEDEPSVGAAGGEPEKGGDVPKPGRRASKSPARKDPTKSPKASKKKGKK